jgi:ASCH domain
MKALSIKQPWAWLIVNGYKDIENRTWATRFTGEVLIHTGKKMDELSAYEKQAIENHIGRSLPTEFELGGIVGKVRIKTCINWSSSFWFTGSYGFVLEDAKQLPFKPCKGQLGFFNVEYEE